MVNKELNPEQLVKAAEHMLAMPGCWVPPTIVVGIVSDLLDLDLEVQEGTSSNEPRYAVLAARLTSRYGLLVALEENAVKNEPLRRSAKALLQLAQECPQAVQTDDVISIVNQVLGEALADLNDPAAAQYALDAVALIDAYELAILPAA